MLLPIFCLLCNTFMCLCYFAGELKLKAVLGHGEQGSMHQWKMTVTATDGGGATIQTAVVVTLTSENTRLLFEQREYATCVASTTSQNVVILEVSLQLT